MQNLTENAPSAQPLIGNFNGQNVNLRRITVEEYDAMIANGVLDENDRVELLNGAIVEKMAIGENHAALNDLIATRLILKFTDKICVKNQTPIKLDEFSEPEPDIFLAKPPLERYFDGHPTPDDIYLIMEISDSTLEYDRNIKGKAYGKAGIRQYLVLNVQEKTIEDYREPSADGFQSKQTLRAGQSFDLVAFPEISLNVSDFLPTEKA